MKNCVAQHVARTPASLSEYGSTIVEVLSELEAELQGVLSGGYVPNDHPFLFKRAFPSRDVLLLPSFDTALDRDLSAVLASV